MKKYLLVIMGICALTAQTSFAQLLLSDFSSFADDADITFGQNGWETPTQAAGTMDFTSGTGLGNYVFFFNTAQDWSAFDSVSLDGSLLSGNTSASYFFAITDDSLNILASVTYSAIELTGAPAVKSLNIVGDLANAFAWQLGGDGSPVSATRISFDDVMLTNAVPEPSTYASLALGAVLLVWVVRRRQTCEV
jgi:hypothetical protein